MRKPAYCICENKGADQLRSNCAADQRLCFRYITSTIPRPPKYEISTSSHLLRLHSPVCVGPGRKPRRQVIHDAAHIENLIMTGLFGDVHRGYLLF